MGLPWKKDESIDIMSNEYTYKMGVNRCFERLLDNDIYIQDRINSSVDHATGVEFATWNEVMELYADPASAAITPGTIMALSATESEILTGCETGKDKFITPYSVENMFSTHNIFPKIVFIDITYKNEIFSIYQVMNNAIAEIAGSNIPPDTFVIVRVIWGRINKFMDKSDQLKQLENKIVTDPFFEGTLSGDSDIFVTFKTTDIPDRWIYVRYRESVPLFSHETKSGGADSWYSIT